MLRYIFVNITLNGEEVCMYCPSKLRHGYVRDLSTGLVYCSPECVYVHTYDTQKALGGFDAEVYPKPPKGSKTLRLLPRPIRSDSNVETGPQILQ
jgi:hypothetical protein